MFAFGNVIPTQVNYKWVHILHHHVIKLPTILIPGLWNNHWNLCRFFCTSNIPYFGFPFILWHFLHGCDDEDNKNTRQETSYTLKQRKLQISRAEPFPLQKNKNAQFNMHTQSSYHKFKYNENTYLLTVHPNLEEWRLFLRQLDTCSHHFPVSSVKKSYYVVNMHA